MKQASSLFKSTSTYASKLNDERWLSFARQIRRMHNNSCQCCKRGGLVLQVHHFFYDAKREPWEYRPDEVTVLCEGCHHRLHEQLQKFRRYVFSKLSPQAFQILNGALAVALDKYDPLVFVHALAELASTPTMVKRYADAWSKEKEAVAA